MFNLFKKKKIDRKREDSSDVEVISLTSQKKADEKPREEINYKKPILEIENKVKNKKIIEVMKNVQDPELMIDIWSLELIYDVEEKENEVEVKMTFTSPACPYGELLLSDLRSKLEGIGIKVRIDVVFSPLWQPTKELREIIGI